MRRSVSFVAAALCALLAASCGPTIPNTVAQGTTAARVSSATPSFKARELPIAGDNGPGAAVYNNGKVIYYVCTGCLAAVAGSVNTSGRAVGSVLTADSQSEPAYWPTPNKTIALPTPSAYRGQTIATSVAEWINHTGEMLGESRYSTGNGAFLTRFYTDGKAPVVFGPPETLENLNDAGNYVFYKYPNGPVYAGHEFAFQPLLPKYAGHVQKAAWISDSNSVTGIVNVGSAQSPEYRVFINAGGETKLIGPSSTKEASLRPEGINDSNEVVGNTKTGIFFYNSGTFIPDITPYVSPQRAYCCAGPGISDAGAFTAFDSTTNKFYLIQPNDP